MNRFYVYEHWRPDTGTCFYVGKGHGRRASVINSKRNRHHRNIVAKLAKLGLSVEVRIIVSSLSEREALQVEIERIAFWRNQGAKLVNLTDGGEGTSGLPSSEKCRALAAARMNEKWKSLAEKDSHCRRMREFWSIPENKARQAERLKVALAAPKVRKAISEQSNLYWANPESRAQQSLRSKERYTSQEERNRLSEQIKAGWAAASDAREALSARMKTRWADPKMRAHQAVLTKSHWTPERRAKRSAQMKEALASSEARAALSASVKAARLRR